MADETLRFDIVGNDRASGAFARAGESAGTLSRHMDEAARSSAILDEALKRQQTAARASVDATLALAKADEILTEAEHALRDGALEAELALKRETEAKKKSARAAEEAAAKNAAFSKSLKDATSAMKDKSGPAWLGPAVLAAPALASIGGVGLGAAAGLGGAFVAGGGALAAFGAIAKPVLSDALKAEQAVQKAQDTYNASIAAGVKQSTAYQKEQIAIGKAYAEMSPQQIALSKQLGAMANAWQNLKAKETPVVAGALQPWLKSVTDGMGKLAPIIAKVSPVIRGLGTQFDALVNSSAFKGFRDFIANTGSKVVGAVGGTLIDFVKAFMILLPKFNPLILDMTHGIAGLGPALLKWANSKKTADEIQKFMAWFHDNAPAVTGLLKNIGGALKALAPGLTQGGVAELNIISGFFGMIAKLPPGLAKPLAEVAGAMLILNKTGALGAGIQIVVKGVREWTQAQSALDVALSANPIGAVLIAVGALAVGFAIAWKQSAGFRDAVKATASAFLDAGVHITQGAKIIVDGVLSMIGATLHGLALLPGPLGAPFRAASKSFDEFKAHTDNVFDGMISKIHGWQAALNASATTVGNITKTIQADFSRQGQGAANAKSDVDKYSAAIHNNGVNSDQAKAARDRLYNDLIQAGLKSTVAHSDVDRYTQAVRDNGASSDAARAARQRLLTDILTASNNSRNGKRDLDTFTAAVHNNGVTSNAYRNARLALINDLIKAGVSSYDAKRLVDGLANSIRHVPGNKGVTIVMQGSGAYTVGGRPVSFPNAPIQIALTRATGGIIPGSGNGDTVPALLTPGELVVPKHMVQAGAVDHLRGTLPGFANGGLVARGTEGVLSGYSAGAMYVDFERKFEQISVTILKTALAAAAAQAAAAMAGSVPARSGSAAAAQRYAASQLGRFGWGAGQMPPLIALWNQECVPYRTMILTRRGWLAHDEVRAGDETIGYNRETGASEWTRITAVHHYGPSETWRFGNKYWSVECTPNHRWLAESIRTRYGRPHGRNYVPAAQAAAGTGGSAEYVESEDFVRLDGLRPKHRVVLARKARTQGTLPISTKEAALLGWIAGDGWVTEPGPRRALSFLVCQTKQRYFSAIDYACSADPLHRRYAPESTGKVTWRLTAKYSRDLLNRAGHPKRDVVAQVLAMSAEQRDAWLDAIICAEGSVSGGKLSVYQSEGPLADAIELAIYLSGNRPSRIKDSRADRVAWVINSTAPTVGGPSRRRFTEPAGYQPVYCVTTELSSWTARQDGQVFLTGNSGWNANAVNRSSGAYGIPQALPAAWGHPYKLGDYANQIIWGLHYIKNRYGSPAAAWGHEKAFNWYAGGTSGAAPGWGVVGEDGPELMHFRGGEQVIPNRALGGNTYVINVAPTPLARPADIGREVVTSIREYEKRSGAGWRS